MAAIHNSFRLCILPQKALRGARFALYEEKRVRMVYHIARRYNDAQRDARRLRRIQSRRNSRLAKAMVGPSRRSPIRHLCAKGVTVLARYFRLALVIVSASTIYHVLRMGYSVFRVTYCVKHNFIYVIFKHTVQDHISRGLAETMIMARFSRMSHIVWVIEIRD